MAKGRLTRFLAVVWDRDAARRLQLEADAAFEKVAASGSKEFEAGMQEGGRKAARTLSRALQQEYRVRMARARLQLAEGTIDERAFEREGREAAEAFNKGLTGGIRRLRAQGNVTELQMAGLAGQFRRVPGAGAAGIFGGMALGGLAAPLAGVLSASTAISAGRDAIDAADRYDAALLKLQGTAKLAGVAFSDLADSAERTRDEFELSVPLANDLTAVATRLAARTGDVAQANQFLTRWMDLSAAAGLTAQEALEALEITFRGQDEGLNRLGLQNPQDIYKRWGAGADEASKAQAVLNEVLTEGAKVQGEYGRFLESNRGQAQQAANEHERLAAEMGKSLQPARELGNALKTGVLEALTGIAREIGTISGWINRAIELEVNLKARFNGQLTTVEQWLRALNHINAPSAGLRLGRWLRNRGDEPITLPGTTALPPTPAALPASASPGAAPPVPEDQEALRQAQARVTAMHQRLDQWMQSQGHYDLMTRMLYGAPDGEGMDLRLRAEGQTFLQEYGEQLIRIEELSQRAAYEMAAAFQDAFGLMREEGVTVGNFLEGIGRGIGGAFLAGLADFAQGKIAENIAAAIEAAAYALGYISHGNFASATAAWAAAGQHTAAAVAWGALAGGAGAGRGAVTGGRGAIPPSTRDVGLDLAREGDREPAPIIIEIDPFNPANPVHARGVGQALDLEVRLAGRPAWVSR